MTLFRKRAGRCVAALVGAGLVMALAAPASRAASVLPPGAKPHGWSIDDMALAVANMSLSGNDLAYYPDTPFQILYRQGNLQDPTGENTFVVKPGTPFYVKAFFIDDSPPVWGNWPADKSEVANYIFGRDQLGGHDFEVEINGKVFSMDDPGYIGGPVAVPNSLGGDHFIQTGAFISPLPVGTHTLFLRATFDGDVILEELGGPFGPFEIKYTVVVEPPGKGVAVPEPASAALAACGLLGLIGCTGLVRRRVRKKRPVL